MKTNTLLIKTAALVIAVLIVITALQYESIKRYKRVIESNDTTTIITKHDTVYKTFTFTDTVREPEYVHVYHRDTLYKDSVPHIITLESKTYENTITNNGDTCTYQAFISGYNLDEQDYPKLDSINLHTSHQIINTYQEVIIEKKTPQNVRKWHLSPSVGVGYGLTQKKCDVYLGVSLGYDIFGK